jgi:hypothetical protein
MNAKLRDTAFRLPTSEPLCSASAPDGVHQHYIPLLDRRLLSEFVLPNATNAVARSPYWNSQFREPVARVLARLKEHGLLIEPPNPHARMCHGRDEGALRRLCLEWRLEPAGSAEQLAERLLTIDPSGWLLGYPGELLQCSELAVRAMRMERGATASAPSMSPSDDQVVWEMLKRHARQTAREGKLARCRDVHITMSNHLLRRNKLGQALQALCIVCAFDMCGARNRARLPHSTAETYPCFDAARASLAPWLVQRVKALCRDMALATDDIREIFIGVGTRLPIPKDSFKLWAVLQVALEGALESDDGEGCSRVIRKLLD